MLEVLVAVEIVRVVRVVPKLDLLLVLVPALNEDLFLLPALYDAFLEEDLLKELAVFRPFVNPENKPALLVLTELAFLELGLYPATDRVFTAYSRESL